METSNFSQNEQYKPNDQSTWERLASASLSCAREVDSFSIGVVPLAGLAGLPAHAELASRTVLINVRGMGSGGQRTIDRVRELLGAKSIRELGFAAARLVESRAPICASEGWAMVVDSCDTKSLRDLVALVEGEEFDSLGRSLDTSLPQPAGADGQSPTEVKPLVPPRRVCPTVGFVPAIHGPASETRTVEISVFEAKLIAQYWIERIVEIEHDWVVLLMSGSQSCFVKPFVDQRLPKLVEAGLLTDRNIDALISAERVRMGLEPAPEPVGTCSSGPTSTTPTIPRIASAPPVHREGREASGAQSR